nr:PREDICTED: proline-rich protein 2-like [Lepisosteus oculatus]
MAPRGSTTETEKRGDTRRDEGRGRGGGSRMGSRCPPRAFPERGARSPGERAHTPGREAEEKPRHTGGNPPPCSLGLPVSETEPAGPGWVSSWLNPLPDPSWRRSGPVPAQGAGRSRRPQRSPIPQHDSGTLGTRPWRAPGESTGRAARRLAGAEEPGASRPGPLQVLPPAAGLPVPEAPSRRTSSPLASTTAPGDGRTCGLTERRGRCEGCAPGGAPSGFSLHGKVLDFTPHGPTSTQRPPLGEPQRQRPAPRSSPYSPDRSPNRQETQPQRASTPTGRSDSTRGPSRTAAHRGP